MGKNSKTEKKNNVYRLVLTAMLSAVAFVLFLVEIPWLSFGFLRYDLSDIAALIGGIFLGPVAGVTIELIKNVLHMLTPLNNTGGFGEIMNFVVGSAYVVCFVMCYNAFSKKMKKAIAILIAAVIGCVFMIVLGAIGNYFIAPLYFRIVLSQEFSKEFWIGYLASATSLNAVKGGILSAVAYPIIFLLVDKLKKVTKL